MSGIIRNDPPEVQAKQLRDLAERIMHTPGPTVDQRDAELLDDVAHRLDGKGPGRAPMDVEQPMVMRGLKKLRLTLDAAAEGKAQAIVGGPPWDAEERMALQWIDNWLNVGV